MTLPQSLTRSQKRIDIYDLMSGKFKTIVKQYLQKDRLGENIKVVAKPPALQECYRAAALFTRLRVRHVTSRQPRTPRHVSPDTTRSTTTLV